MKFLADMGISPNSVNYLAHLGFEAVHLQMLGLEKLKDEQILEKTRSEGYILLTHDLDFSDLLAASGANLPSVVIFRLRNMRPDNVNHYLVNIINQYSKDLVNGAVIAVTEGRLRIRELPIT